MTAQAKEIPPHIAANLSDVREFEASHIIASLVGSKSKILVIGDSWGREYYSLGSLGKEVTALDIAPQKHIPDLIVGDITKKTHFKDQTFDAVIVAEVLEHLLEDYLALKEIRRILRNDGLLIITSPFYHDNPEYHIRIHSEKTIKRLLAACGFKPTHYVARGGLINFADLLNRLVGYSNKISPKLGLSLLKKILSFDLFLGQSKRSWPFLKRSKYAGCYLTAVKSENTSLDKMNIQEFSH